MAYNIWQLNDKQLGEYADYLKRHGYGYADQADEADEDEDQPCCADPQQAAARLCGCWR